MKKYIKRLFVLSVLASAFTACDTEEEFDIPSVRVPYFKEDFQAAVDGTVFDLAGWTNFSEAGTKKWGEEAFSGNGYAEFSAFNSGSVSNKAWLISPAINVDQYDNDRMTFRVAQHHLDVDSPNNSLQVLISTDFNGTDVLAATWTPVNANIPKKAVAWYEFLTSSVDLSGYSGNIYVAFKFTGSGTDLTLDGAFQVDDLLIYNEK
ncbi:MAG: choice-of-anchor J domain-containing protein [Bacteroidota bacterium]